MTSSSFSSNSNPGNPLVSREITPIGGDISLICTESLFGEGTEVEEIAPSFPCTTIVALFVPIVSEPTTTNLLRKQKTSLNRYPKCPKRNKRASTLPLLTPSILDGQ